MKSINKGLLLGLGLVSTSLLFSCSNGGSTSSDTSSLNTTVADKWFSLGNTGEGRFDTAYTTCIYDPTLTEDSKPSSYYTIYAASDVNASVRLTLTEINADNFGETTTNTIKNLQTIAYSTTNQSEYMSKVYEKKYTINSMVDDITSSVQSTWNTDLSTFNVSSSSLQADKTNYLCVYYIPFYVRTYSNNSIASAGFFAAPIYASVTTGNITKDADGNDIVSVEDETATKFLKSQYITFTYNSSTDTIC